MNHIDTFFKGKPELLDRFLQDTSIGCTIAYEYIHNSIPTEPFNSSAGDPTNKSSSKGAKNCTGDKANRTKQ